ncbi:hypothetical protein AVEN_135839-1 [Araneus ventricosus]|uniref:DUF1758 domain-containing protein n=1 Tax=Araneus ventricosus TaxID=182803 RepID=A0A4Y2E7E0_ARAVE|nr:hypothetical protein AVEN_134990-1 [Araneus ventricosus]GBM25076.1 hypothetical protein AVEN_135839-1 [Araneus ventricosus]
MAGDELKDFLTKKRVLKAQLTKFKEKIDFEEIDKSKGDLIVDKCKELKKKFEDVFDAIYTACDETVIDSYVEEQESILENIDEIYLTVVRKFKISNCSSSKTEVSDSIKLPKLSLPTFTGNINEWITFKDLFNAAVNNNSSLSDSQRLTYLKLSLKYEAFKIIQSIPVSDSNYKIAWNLLEERYSNKREQVFALIKRLMSLQQIQSESTTALLNLVDNINEIIRSLDILKQNVENFSDTLILYIILQKLDNSSRMWFERQLKKDEIPKLNNLIEFLKDHARTLQHSKPSSNKYQKSYKATSLLSNFKCVYCNEDHTLQKCSKFLNLHVDQRVGFVKSKHLCFACLSHLHMVKKCKSTSSCKHCQKRHNTLLHIDSNLSVQNQGLSPQAEVFVPSSEPTTSNMVPSTSVCANNLVKEKQNTNVLLCTAVVNILNSKNQLVSARCILDSASQKSYIKRSLVKKLVLNVKNKSISISCLGAAETVASGEIDFTFTPHFNQKFHVKTSAFLIEKITDNIPTINLPQSLKDSFSDLLLADPNFHNASEIDVLLGVNVFLSLMKGETIKRDERLPFALSTKLGWVIAGSTAFPVENLQETSDRNFQKILWRDNPSSPIKTYRLCTVTYGTASASYLATRVLKQLAIDESSNFPKASEVLLHNCYVDDVLFGADYLEAAEKLIPELQELLCSGGFKLHKWCSNEKSVLERAIKTEDSKNSCEIIDAKSIKILGLEWEPALDEFYCNFEISNDGDLPTKRTILSSVSKIFDPLGCLAPFIIGAKILIQSIWTFQISWDDPVPEEINKKWTVFRDQLHHLKSIRIPRRVLLPNATKIELHAFCDASKKGICFSHLS